MGAGASAPAGTLAGAEELEDAGAAFEGAVVWAEAVERTTTSTSAAPLREMLRKSLGAPGEVEAMVTRLDEAKPLTSTGNNAEFGTLRRDGAWWPAHTLADLG